MYFWNIFGHFKSRIKAIYCKLIILVQIHCQINLIFDEKDKIKSGLSHIYEISVIEERKTKWFKFDK